MVDSRPPELPAEPGPASRRLGSWKEIARYLGRTVRTVQRWEQTLDLPVRRLQHDGGASVFAYTHELDRWLTRRSLVVHTGQRDAAAEGSSAPDTAPSATVPGTSWRRLAAYGLAIVAVLAMAAVYMANRLFAPTRLPAERLVPRHLTTNPGIERFPALSPDARQVVYTWDNNGGQVDLYLRMVDADGHIRLTSDAKVEEGPTWSPDGLAVAFLRRSGDGRRELRVIPALGGQERLLTTFEVPLSLDSARSQSASADWSPDGRWIAFTRSGAAADSVRLSAINLEDGRMVDLTSPGEGEFDISPQFSPDGTLLAYADLPSSLKGSLHVMEFDADTGKGGRSWKLPDALPWNSEPAWTPDGRELVFTSGRWPRTGLWRVAADGSTEPRPLVEIGAGGSQPSVAALAGAADGDATAEWRLAFGVITLENDIWEIDLEKEGGQRPLLSTSQRERFPAYAPDGRIAFISDRSGDREIWVAGADGRKWQQWTDWRSAYIWRPAFSPDGLRLAYTVEIDHVMRLHVQDEPLAPARDLSGGSANDTDLAWARDGGSIYVSSTNRGGGEHAVWAVPLDGTEPRKLLEGNALPLGEDPGSRWLFLTEPGPQQVLLQRLDLRTGVLDLIDLAPAERHSFTLGPEGVYFVAVRDDRWEIHRWDWETGEQAAVRTLDHEPEVGMAISPDGSHALLARISLQRSDLMVADAQR